MRPGAAGTQRQGGSDYGRPKRWEDSIAFRVLAAGHTPHHRTICRFREGHLDEFNRLFVQVLEIAIDGSKTKDGRDHYRRRKHVVEPVFRWVKHVLGFRAFSMRGLCKVAGEWRLACLGRRLYQTRCGA